METMNTLLAVVIAIAFALCIPFSDTPADYRQQTYGPGHENHQFASWDNGDGTHTVACDCGIEKRIEYHADKDSDGMCDVCGSRLDE